MDSKLDKILADLRLLERRVRRIEDLNNNDINVDKRLVNFYDIIYLLYIYLLFIYFRI